MEFTIKLTTNLFSSGFGDQQEQISYYVGVIITNKAESHLNLTLTWISLVL